MRSYLPFVLLLCLCVPTALWAQITFDASDLPFDAGAEIDYEHSNPLVYIPLDPGPAGANQAWDFSNVVVDIAFHHSWIEPAASPGSAYFPNANRCQHYLDSYEYWNLSSSGFTWLGLYDDGSGDTTIYHGGEPIWAFPCQYGYTWTTTFLSFLPGGTGGTLEDSIEFEVDGWGTVTDLMGTFDCLRLKAHHTMTISNPPYSFVTTQWGYYWMVPGKAHMVYMESELNETNPNFTSGYFRRMTDINTGVRPLSLASTIPTQISLLPAFPNPCNPSTQLTFNLPKSGDITLTVYDLAGREVAQVAKGWFAPGAYQASFDGSSLVSGVYLARLQAQGFNQTQKIVLAK